MLTGTDLVAPGAYTVTIGAGGTYSYTLSKATSDLAGNETETFTYTVTDLLTAAENATGETRLSRRPKPETGTARIAKPTRAETKRAEALRAKGAAKVKERDFHKLSAILEAHVADLRAAFPDRTWSFAVGMDLAASCIHADELGDRPIHLWRATLDALLDARRNLQAETSEHTRRRMDVEGALERVDHRRSEARDRPYRTDGGPEKAVRDARRDVAADVAPLRHELRAESLHTREHPRSRRDDQLERRVDPIRPKRDRSDRCPHETERDHERCRRGLARRLLHSLADQRITVDWGLDY